MRSERGDRAPRRARRAAGVLAAVAACAVLSAGCGIRSTSVPVDAGAAPSRVPCRTAAGQADAPPPETVAVRVHLVCASQLVTVERTVRLDESLSDPLPVAQVLLGELRREPSADERRAGFSTAVPPELRVAGARKGDPKGTLRLSEQPEDLPAEALAQVVCTYAESEPLGTGGSVLLGGPGTYAPRNYLCTSETRSRPENVPTVSAAELP